MLRHVVNRDTIYTYVACRKINDFLFLLFSLRLFFFLLLLLFSSFVRTGTERRGTMRCRRHVNCKAGGAPPYNIIDEAKGRGSRLRRTRCAEDVN